MQKIYLDLTPKKEKPIVYVSQYDNKRLFDIQLMEDGTEIQASPSIDYSIEIRKPDNNIVTLGYPEVQRMTDGTIRVSLTEQACACFGDSFGELILEENDIRIGTCNFILNVELSPEFGGILSASEIKNLRTQIAAIIPEILSDDYYTKNETDERLDAKADVSNVYSKTQIDKIILAIMPEEEAGPASVVNFETEIAAPLVNVICDIVAQGGGGTPVSPIPIVAYSQANINANGDAVIIDFGQTVYGGQLIILPDRTYIHVTWGGKDMGNLTWVRNTQYNNPIFLANIPEAKNAMASGEIANTKCEILTATTAQNCNNISYDNCYSIMLYFNSSYNINVVTKAYNDIPSFVSAVTGKKIIYELDTPFDIDLTPVQIISIVGSNSVSSNTNGNTTVKYKDSIQHYIDNH